MIWFERMNKAIDYIEDNLCNDIDFNNIAKIVCQSPANFQRTFSIVTDISVFEYIRRRKLTLAAFDMQNSTAKVIDIALKYGYESPESFTRAFKETHGVSPTGARKQGLPLKAYPRIAFLLSIKGDAVMEYRIENKEAFLVYGIEGIFNMENDQHLKDLPAFWRECWQDGRCEQLLKSTNDPSSGVHAVCSYRETGGSTFPYAIFTHHTEGCNTEGFTQIEIPAATWAIFKSEKHAIEQTTGVVQSLIKRVYTDWLPTAAYNHLDGYGLEMYLDAGDGMFYFEFWIRVEKV